MLFVRTAVLVACLSGLAVALIACSDDDRPPAVVNVGNTSSSSSSSSGSSGLPLAEAGAGDAGADLCTPVEQTSQVVGELEILGDPPTATGGTIVAGTYVLNELSSFSGPKDAGGDPPPPGSTGNYARSTIVVTALSIRFVTSRGTNPDALPADTTRSVTYNPNGSNLEITEACGGTAAPSKLPFSTDGTLLTLLVAANKTETYLRKQ